MTPADVPAGPPGDGQRLFDLLGPEPIELETLRVIDSPTRTDIQLRFVT